MDGGKRDISKISGPRQAWRSRYVLTETCIWVEHFAIHSACLLAAGTQDVGPGGYVPHIVHQKSFPSLLCGGHQLAPTTVVCVMVCWCSVHLSLAAVVLDRGIRAMLVWALVVLRSKFPRLPGLVGY